MTNNTDSPSLYDKATAQYYDTNGDGRFEAVEILKVEDNVLRKVELLSRAAPGTLSNQTLRVLETMNLEDARANFEIFQLENTRHFRCGIEMPNDAQLEEDVKLAHAVASQARQNLAHTTLASKLSAIAALGADYLEFKAGIAEKVFEVAVDSNPTPTSCPATAKPSIQR